MYTINSSPNYTVAVSGVNINISGATSNNGVIGDTNWTDCFDTMAEYIKMQETWLREKDEQLIRERNPAVQAAWEQYRILVGLARDFPKNY
jgi:hypothetical protein